MLSKLLIECQLHRTSIAVPGESAAAYALIKLTPTAAAAEPLPLNLALALDVSGSMYELDGTGSSRLQRIQQAATAAIARLRPTDTLALIAFGKNAAVVLPATALADREPINRVIQDIDLFDVDPGGTAMDEAIRLAVAEVEKKAGPSQLSHVVVLTDGATSGEAACREEVAAAAGKGLRFSLMGVGTEWNARLIKELARLGGGQWHYIDANQPGEAERIFLQEFAQLAAATFQDAELDFRPVRDVRVKRLRQVAPEIREIPFTELEERHRKAALGHLERDRGRRYVVDLSLPPRPDGRYVIARVEIGYRLAGGERETAGPVSLEVLYSAAGPGYVNAEVAKHIDEVQIFELNQHLQEALATNNQTESVRLAGHIARKGELLGPRGAKKTMLARQVLDELHQGGRVSRKTQLAVDDAARVGAEH
jgi:Ca-activated chloride channel family protein